MIDDISAVVIEFGGESTETSAVGCIEADFQTVTTLLEAKETDCWRAEMTSQSNLIPVENA
jgi:hypothetical protein